MTDSTGRREPRSQNITWHRGKITPEERQAYFRQEAATVWLTGLSGAGKSTLAFELERRLFAAGHACYVLDGDNVRHGLNRDLGFAPEQRSENIRRVAEVARLFNEAGMFVITAFISPYRADRAMAREIIGHGRFLETWLETDIAVCESRDPKGLYKKARAGEIGDFTGISAPYEAPLNAELRLDTGVLTPEQSLDRLMAALAPRFLA